MVTEGGVGTTDVETVVNKSGVDRLWTLPLPGPPLITAGNRLTRGIKRAIDIAAGGVLLVAATPVMAAVAVAVAVTSPGPIFFRQTRVTQNGALFHCLKFRTMVTDADDRLTDLLAVDEDLAIEFREGHKLRRDPRTTRIGRILRLSSLDELPQLVNVLRGEMSLVGPRPVVPEELTEHYGPLGAQLVTVRPGLSGPWQVSGRNKLSYTERVELDIDYTATWTLGNDIRLLAQTVGVLARPTTNGAS